MDLIDRQDAIEHCKKRLYESALNNVGVIADDIFSEIADNRIEIWLNELPSAEPVIYCKDCVRHNVSVEDWYNNYELKVCPLVAHRGKAIGHEFDYQFCVCAERRNDE